MFNITCPKCAWNSMMMGSSPKRYCKCGQNLKDSWRCDHGKKAGECTNERCIFNKKNTQSGWN